MKLKQGVLQDIVLRCPCGGRTFAVTDTQVTVKTGRIIGVDDIGCNLHREIHYSFEPQTSSFTSKVTCADCGREISLRPDSKDYEDGILAEATPADRDDKVTPNTQFRDRVCDWYIALHRGERISADELDALLNYLDGETDPVACISLLRGVCVETFASIPDAVLDMDIPWDTDGDPVDAYTEALHNSDTVAYFHETEDGEVVVVHNE